MTIPDGSLYPEVLDDAGSLYDVQDGLRVVLAEDYTPGDTSVTVTGDTELFPPTGLITLTEQCSDPVDRAVSFYYGSRTETTFDELELLDAFNDNVVKPKGLTNVTQNVMAQNRNNLKDAVIAVEGFAGRKGEIATHPLEGTMEARINYLRKLALTPRAWFTAKPLVGLVPLEVEFTDLSFRLGTDGTSGTIIRLWDFGDNSDPSTATTTIEETDDVPVDADNVLVSDTDGGKIRKTYTRPGIYDVKLTVINDFGQDAVILPLLINARVPAPDEAVIDIDARTSQIFAAGEPAGGPYTTPPTLRTPTNTLIDLEVPRGENLATGRSYAGEELNDMGSAIDPVVSYTWSLADDLAHGNSPTTKASYSVGGVYDLVLRVDTAFGAYRITTYPGCFDVVERTNLWLWTFDDATHVKSYEFGLSSETFKTQSASPLTVVLDDSFLNGEPNEAQQRREFLRNNGFAPRSLTASGSGGTGIMYWASGRPDGGPGPDAERIVLAEYNGFADTYLSRDPTPRPWNWVGFSATEDIYFVLGGVTDTPNPGESPTNQTKTKYNLATFVQTAASLQAANYKNGAGELRQNVVSYDGSGNPQQGHMSVYRSCWRGDTGYLLRNDGVGSFFRLRSFYKTAGNTTEPFQDFRKLSDMSGFTKVEGQIVPMADGVFFFNNTGSVSAFNTASSVWESGSSASNATSFRLLQDSSTAGYDSEENTLLAVSDGDRVVYLSYDYSQDAFLKFDATDLTFSRSVSRPAGTQWMARIF